MNNRIPPPIVALICGLSLYFSRPAFPTIQSGWSDPIALCLLILGISILVAAVLSFKKQDTTVNPLQPEKASSLVITGLFKYSRNPMYLGMLLLLLSLTAKFNVIGGLLITLGFLLFMTKFQIIPEECALESKFGEKFTQYTRQTRRWL